MSRLLNSIRQLSSALQFHKTLWELFPRSERGRALLEEIHALQQKEEAMETESSSPGFYSCVFVVAKASNGFCQPKASVDFFPVIDMSFLSHFIHKTKFPMEAKTSVLSAISDRDLQDTYFQILMNPKSSNFTEFERTKLLVPSALGC